MTPYQKEHYELLNLLRQALVSLLQIFRLDKLYF
jgi:hypothetical protein